jgi:single-stranded-DNA-specific exonuclease
VTGNGVPHLPPPPPPTWRLREAPDPDVVRRLAGELSLPPALCGILAARGQGEPEQARRFLRPRLDDLPAPETLADAPRAARRILAAVDAGETILVHGDYDVDGVCATAVLTRWLRRQGASAEAFVPHRIRDGYDLGEGGLAAARKVGATLIITCDSGVRAVETVRRAMAEGIDVIVTDHHTPGPELPPALAVVNPARPDCPHPAKELCGAGVVFQLARLLARIRGIPEEELFPHLDLVALATVADLVPLTGANRVLVRFGLRYLAHTEKVGLQALMAAAGLVDVRDRGVEAGQVGFVLAPRINAVGRMGDAATALRLLLTEDPEEAAGLAGELEAENGRRREEDRRTLDQALEQLAADYDPLRDLGVVVAGEGWHPGVIGIVASRLVERIHRPVILMALDGDRARGSARSIPDVHLYEAVDRCSGHLIRYGGHRQAAGMELAAHRIPAFREAFNRAVRSQLKAGAPPPILRVDAELPLEEATEDLHHWLRYLGPFGMGNPRPVFLARSAPVVQAPRVVGRDHLKLRLGNGSAGLDAIGFGLAGRVAPSRVGGRVDLAFQLRENEFRGRTTLQARLLDLRAAEGAEPGGVR